MSANKVKNKSESKATDEMYMTSIAIQIAPQMRNKNTSESWPLKGSLEGSAQKQRLLSLLTLNASSGYIGGGQRHNPSKPIKDSVLLIQ